MIDDEPNNVRLLADVLDRKGYDVTFAMDGVSALRMAMSQPPDVILLDISMPKMDGFSVCKRTQGNVAY